MNDFQRILLLIGLVRKMQNDIEQQLGGPNVQKATTDFPLKSTLLRAEL